MSVRFSGLREAEKDVTMTTKPRKKWLPTTDFVIDQANFRRAQMILRNLPISDRAIADKVQDLIRDLDGNGYELWRPEEREPWRLIDDVWNGDPRYLRKFLKLDRCVYPERDKYLFLLIKLRFPNVYRHLV